MTEVNQGKSSGKVWRYLVTWLPSMAYLEAHPFGLSQWKSQKDAPLVLGGHHVRHVALPLRLFKIFQLKGTPRPASWPGVERMGHYLSSFPSWEEKASEKFEDPVWWLNKT